MNKEVKVLLPLAKHLEESPPISQTASWASTQADKSSTVQIQQSDKCNKKLIVKDKLPPNSPANILCCGGTAGKLDHLFQQNNSPTRMGWVWEGEGNCWLHSNSKCHCNGFVTAAFCQPTTVAAVVKQHYKRPLRHPVAFFSFNARTMVRKRTKGAETRCHRVWTGSCSDKGGCTACLYKSRGRGAKGGVGFRQGAGS